MFKLKLARSKKDAGEEWPYRCRAHNRPTGLLCSRCLQEPLCVKCARQNHGLGYICRRCEAELIAQYEENARQTRAVRAAARMALLAVGVMCASGCNGLAGAAPVPDPLGADATLVAALEASVATRVAATVQALPTAAPVATPSLDAPQVACRLWLTATIDVPYREGPGTSYPPMGQMLAGQSAEVLSHDGSFSWWLVPLIDGRTAWVPGAAAQLSDCANVPFIETPTPAG